MTGPIVLPGKGGCIVVNKRREVLTALYNDGGMDVVGHLAEFKNLDGVVCCRDAEDGKEYEMVCFRIEKHFSFFSPLVTVVQYPFVTFTVISSHGVKDLVPGKDKDEV